MFISKSLFISLSIFVVVVVTLVSFLNFPHDRPFLVPVLKVSDHPLGQVRVSTDFPTAAEMFPLNFKLFQPRWHDLGLLEVNGMLSTPGRCTWHH